MHPVLALPHRQHKFLVQPPAATTFVLSSCLLETICTFGSKSRRTGRSSHFILSENNYTMPVGVHHGQLALPTKFAKLAIAHCTCGLSQDALCLAW